MDSDEFFFKKDDDFNEDQSQEGKHNFNQYANGLN
jgi:hypothetical protein